MKNKYLIRMLIALAFLLGMMLIIAGCGSADGQDDSAPESQVDAAPSPGDADASPEAWDWADYGSDDFQYDAIEFEQEGLFEIYSPVMPQAPTEDGGGNITMPHVNADDEPQAEDEHTADAITPQAQQGPATLGVDLMQRMIIRAANMTLNTLYYSDTTVGIETIVLNRGGFIENSRQWMAHCPYAGMLWRAEYVIRVPVGLFDTTNNELMALAQVQYFSTTSRDATHEFNDLGSRLQIREAEEVRVQRMLDEATQLEDIINLEARLTSLRLAIDAYRRRREEIDQLASFSTINLSVFEVIELPEIEDEEEDEYYPILVADSFGDRISGAFHASANFTMQALEAVGVFLALIILPGALLTVVLAGAYFAAKKVSGSKMLEWLKP